MTQVLRRVTAGSCAHYTWISSCVSEKDEKGENIYGAYTQTDSVSMYCMIVCVYVCVCVHLGVV